MTYQETLDYLFNALPMFQRIGASAYKTDLNNTLALCEELGNPHLKFKSIHIAGTNGKGSTSHSLAAILQSAGYKVGLYTSPHLKSFRERIKINGQDITEQAVIHFVQSNKSYIDSLQPSFFEMTVGMAFSYFAEEAVDIAVVEVGMGGRLDSTNILKPLLSIITNIGMDHMQFLGDTLPKIAAEKAGIIKSNTPVIISQRQAETTEVFTQLAQQRNAEITFAERSYTIKHQGNIKSGLCEYLVNGKIILMDLAGKYQEKNLAGILTAVDKLRSLGIHIPLKALHYGLANVTSLTGLKGRWQKLNDQPLAYCDTGHNIDGIAYIISQIQTYSFNQLYCVIGMVQDKDVDAILNLFPKDAAYIFCQPSIPRAMPAHELASKALDMGIRGEIISDVNKAYQSALDKAGKNDFIFIGGSTFVVADLDII
ncbi:bifunctional folylpolyglutamate synthase/dihydrofolate synthase [Anditalea andensis]|uniref:Dihydrofolate synthase/folylpolyglutamate synthase n=1 Tax=Anditalea andensis TaxID=1048983 RepID=A0A074L0K3_9BACT|nr:folylpolyglutamate synthase/dihydrofolate synthase family protein [Anditalea andensis]KEO74005.1 dihydrofolate synthase [Anditalea andensis]